MNNIFNVKTPAEKQAAAMRSDYGLKNIGLSNLRKAYWNLPPEALYEEIIFRGEGNISHQGP
ncbi:MAG: phosphoenolpyruvate carboxykinase (ATP), partial [Anaerolineae bacterium]|nr:phosphoenolpyruvate carboxykinase (ATP) [Anaerolineae bacterium]